MAQTGHAILGDRFYASDEVMNRTDRLCLHAFYLNFSHPISGNKLEFTSKPEFLKTLPEI